MKKISAYFMLSIGISTMSVFQLPASQEYTKRVCRLNYIITESSSDIQLRKEPIKFKFPDTSGNYSWYNDIGKNAGGSFLIDSTTLTDYKVYIYNYLSNSLKKYIINKKIITFTKIVYLTEKFFYTIEHNDEKPYFIKRYHNGKICKKQSLKLNYIDSINIRRMIVDEKNKLILFSVAENGRFKDKICIYSLKTEKIIFEDTGKLLFGISNETHNLYYTNGHEIFCIKCSSDFEKIHIHSFLKSPKETVNDLIKINRNYILITEQEKFNLLCKFLFGHHDSIDIYYYCELRRGRLMKIKKLFKEKNGIILN